MLLLKERYIYVLDSASSRFKRQWWFLTVAFVTFFSKDSVDLRQKLRRQRCETLRLRRLTHFFYSIFIHINEESSWFPVPQS